ncbi:hypothetical protein ACJX0J_012132 [Zea mays]
MQHRAVTGMLQLSLRIAFFLDNFLSYATFLREPRLEGPFACMFSFFMFFWFLCLVHLLQFYTSVYDCRCFHLILLCVFLLCPLLTKTCYLTAVRSISFTFELVAVVVLGDDAVIIVCFI